MVSPIFLNHERAADSGLKGLRRSVPTAAAGDRADMKDAVLVAHHLALGFGDHVVSRRMSIDRLEGTGEITIQGGDEEERFIQ